jgi:predicted ATPase
MNTVQSDSPDQFNELSSEFQAIIPSLGRVSAPLRGNQVTVRFQEEGRVDVTLANTSDGVLQATGIAGALLTFPANSLVLIEEPEIHLHAAAQRQLFSLMKRLTEKKGHQFLVTTHSTVFSQSSEMVETYLITKNEGNSALRQIAAGESLQLIKHDLGHENPQT